MPRDLGEILRRFRPVVAPGMPAPAGVPVDMERRREEELQPVFDALAGAVAEVAALHEQAAADAARRELESEAESARLIGDARAHVTAVRAAAAAERLRGIDTERADVVASGRRTAEAIRTRARERLPGFVERVMECVRATGAAEEESG